jgi:hypothetical protein
MTTDAATVCAELVASDPTLAYGNGRCYAMFAQLRAIYGTRARPYYDGDHITTLIDGQHYDARGRVTPAPNAQPLNHARAVSQMRRNAERAA